MNWSDYGARNYDATLGRWMNIDNYSESFVSETPYQYTLNNPIYFIDPDGNLTQGGHQATDDTIIIQGESKNLAFNELQSSVADELNLSMDENGVISYTKIGEGPLSSDAQDLINAIEDTEITVNINTTSGMYTSDEALFFAGAFGGNEVDPLTGTVQTFQDVNPLACQLMDCYAENYGVTTLHEVVESHKGGEISLASGNSAEPADQASVKNPNSVYNRAHNASPQHSSFRMRLIDSEGNVTRYPNNAVKIQWYVKNDNKPEQIIQEYNAKD